MSKTPADRGTIEARALTRAANYFRDMSQETLTRRRVIEILDYLASEAEPSPSDRCTDCGLMRRTHPNESCPDGFQPTVP